MRRKVKKEFNLEWMKNYLYEGDIVKIIDVKLADRPFASDKYPKQKVMFIEADVYQNDKKTDHFAIHLNSSKFAQFWNQTEEI